MNRKKTKRMSKDTKSFQSPYTISSEQILYRPKTEGVYPICLSDWERLKRTLQSLTTPSRLYGFLASGFLGLFGSSLLSIIDMCNRDSVSDWFKITMWCVFIISLILLVVFYLLDKQIKKDSQRNSEDVLNEMKIIESKFNPPLNNKLRNDSSTPL